MLNLNESRMIENIEEDTSKKDKVTHFTFITASDKDYELLDKKDFAETKHDVKEIKSLIYSLLYTQNLQIEIPQNIPELLSPKRIKEEKGKITKVKEKFESLVKKWKEETRFASTVLEMATHPAYQQIIGMGPVAIPLILNRLREELDHWFWALKAITGEDPVPQKSRGNLEQMAKAWLAWGQEKGYDQ